MSTWNEVKGELRDLAKAVDVGLTVECDLARERVIVVGGRQPFEFPDFASAKQALELANYVAFQREVRKRGT